MQPKDTTNNEAFKGFTNHECPFLPCHKGVKREFNCLFCYCPLIAYECPGPYLVFEDTNGLKRKDCSACSLNHDGYRASWAFIQKWLEQPVIWNGHEQSPRYLPKARQAASGPATAEPDDADER
jgi:Zn-finger protein